MNMKSESVRTSLRSLAVAGLIAGAMSVLSSVAFAGDCPADQVVPDGKGQTAGATAPKDVTDNVLASIDLAKEKVGADHLFRMRRLVIQPGGIVPWHNHADRPALIYVVEGEITEYASTCAVPILHAAGDVSVDAGRSHWWKNTGSKTVVLISADILHDPKEAGMM